MNPAKPSEGRHRAVPHPTIPSLPRPSFAAVSTMATSLYAKLPRRPPAMSIIRLGIYITVVLWTVICLAIVAHFQSILIAGDLTHFVPFALFVCCITLVIILILIVTSLRTNWNRVPTRVELACLGLMGTFWLALAALLLTSESESADVECFNSESDTTPIDFSEFTTDTYHAQYRVLEAFSLFNLILIWAFGLLLLGLTLRQHFLGHKKVWFIPVTEYPWFNKQGVAKAQAQQKEKLPFPVTTKSGRSRSKSQSKPSGSHHHGRTHSRTRSRSRSQTLENRDRKGYRELEKPLPIAAKFSQRHTEGPGYDSSRYTTPHRSNSTRPHRSNSTRPHRSNTVESHRSGRQLERTGSRHDRNDKYARGASPRR